MDDVKWHFYTADERITVMVNGNMLRGENNTDLETIQYIKSGNRQEQVAVRKYLYNSRRLSSLCTHIYIDKSFSYLIYLPLIQK